MIKSDLKNKNIAIVGLGYVGLPLAVEFGKNYSVVGFDLHQERIEELRNGIDKTREVNPNEINEAQGLKFTTKLEDLKGAHMRIVLDIDVSDIFSDSFCGLTLVEHEIVKTLSVLFVLFETVGHS